MLIKKKANLLKKLLREKIRQEMGFSYLKLSWVHEEISQIKTFECFDNLYSQTDIAALWQF